MSAVKVSVVLPCYNAEAYVREAVASILGQTEGDLEILALDDGSTDGTGAILAEMASEDSRVRVLTNPENLGLILTLNRGISEARGEFVARMDADDVALPHRLEEQLRVLQEDPETGVVGSGIRLVDEERRPLAVVPPRATAPQSIRFLSLFATPIAHPSSVARREVLRDHPYHAAAETLHTEDYELFSRMIRAGVVLRNVPQPLLDMRVHAASVSRAFERIQIENFVRCAGAHLERMTDLRPPPQVLRVLVNRMNDDTQVADLACGLGLLDRLWKRFRDREPHPAVRGEITAVADEQRLDILLQALLRGEWRLRGAAAVLALRYTHRLLSSASRSYLNRKLNHRRG